jgi:hypothetical protein
MADDKQSQSDDLLAKLDKEFPPGWQPEKEGETITGVFLRLETGFTSFGESRVAVLATDEGERSVWLFHNSLWSEFRRAQPAPGERIAIRYLGMQDVKSPVAGRNSKFHAYRVAVDRPEGQPVDWAAEPGVIREPGN